MPTQLPSGLLIYNATAHDIAFLCGEEIVIAEQDGILNAKIVAKTVEEYLSHSLSVNTFEPLPSGLALIDTIRHQWPDILIIGSQIAAQAYPGEVVYPLPISRGRVDSSTLNKNDRLNRSDKFIVFRKAQNRG